MGAVYDFGSKDVDLRSPRSYFSALKSCIEEHPFLAVVVKSHETEKPFYERVPNINIADHIIMASDLRGDVDTSSVETESIEAVLGPAADRSWLSTAGISPWRIFVHPITLSPNTKPTRCFIAFSFSHALGDGLAGQAFHRTFLNAVRFGQEKQDMSQTVVPSQPLQAAFDTPERLPISWGFLLGPLLAVILPKVVANLFGLRSATSTIDKGTWLGPPTFFKPGDFQTQIKLLEINNSILQAALHVSRKNGTKLTATLHQIIIRALSRALPVSEAKNFVTGTSVNMRSSIGAPENEIGLYVTGYYEQQPRNDSTGPLSTSAWTAARVMTKSLAESAVRLQDQPIGLLRYAPSIRGYLTGKLGGKRDCSYEVSNLLVFSNPVANAECVISKMVFAQPSSVLSAPLIFNVISVKGGSMMIAVNWQPGSLGIARSEEKKFVESICESIRFDLAELEGKEMGCTE